MPSRRYSRRVSRGRSGGKRNVKALRKKTATTRKLNAHAARSVRGPRARLGKRVSRNAGRRPGRGSLR